MKDEDGKDKRVRVCEWEGELVERRGLLKVDILGIRQLDIFKRVLVLIKKRKGKEINFSEIPLDDDKVFELFRRGDTEGVFQFKSKTQKPGKLPTKSGYTVLLELSNGKNSSW